MQWNIALDIGASGVRMAIRGHGTVYRQSSAMAVYEGADQPSRVGNEAAQLIGRDGANVRVGFPISQGACVDERFFRMWCQYLLRQASLSALAHRPRVLMAHAPGAQPGQIRQAVALLMEAGASACSAVRSDLAAALGAPVDVHAAQAMLLCQIGAGSMSASLIAGGRVVRSKWLPWGLSETDAAIARRLRAQRGLIIGPRTAEDIKLTLCSALKADAAPFQSVRAVNARTSFPLMARIESQEAREAAEPAIEALLELIREVIDQAGPQMAADLVDNGVILSGAGAQMYGLDRRIGDELGLSCHLPEDPGACVIRGLNAMLESPEKYEDLSVAHVTLLEKKTL